MDILGRIVLFRKKIELRWVEKKFRKNNNIPKNTDEPYVKYFRRALGNFIAGNELLDDSPNVKSFLLKVIKNDFVYYSKDSIDRYLKDINRKLGEFLDENCCSINDCYISSISNKDTSINNSSKELMVEFRKVANLPRNSTRTFEECIAHEVKYTKDIEKLDEGKSKNPYNKFLDSRRKKIYENYKIRKLEISQELREKLKAKKYLIFLDDFSGSGSTIINYFKILEEYIQFEIGIILICVHSMEKADNKIREYFENSKFKEHYYFYTNDENSKSKKKYFKTKKDKLKREIRDFETKNFEQQFALGFEATEALVATYDSCPNNTFSSFWYSENNKWSPLFKRPRKQSDALDNLNLTRNEFVREVKTGLKKRNVRNEDIEQVIILLCIKQMKNSTTTRVDIEIEDKFYYNRDRLQEYLLNKFIKLKNNRNGYSSYALTLKGKSKLKDYQLSNMTFEKLVKNDNSFDAEDSISIDASSSYESDLLNKSAE